MLRLTIFVIGLSWSLTAAAASELDTCARQVSEITYGEISEIQALGDCKEQGVAAAVCAANGYVKSGRALTWVSFLYQCSVNGSLKVACAVNAGGNFEAALANCN